MNITRLLLFLLVFTSVLGAGHYYLWRRLVKDASLSPRWHRLLSWLVLGLLATQPLAMLLGRHLPRHLTAPFVFVAFVWLGMVSTYFALLFSTDISRLAIRLTRAARALISQAEEQAVPSPERRAAMGRMFAGGVALSGTTIGGVAVTKAIAGFSIAEVEIILDKLPRAFDGFKIVQLSDVHVGPTIGRAFVEQMVAASNSLDADLVAITGDLVDGSVENLRAHTEPLRDLTSRLGTFFVTGNHEYYSGADDWVDEMKRLGIRVLRNSATHVERDGESFVLAGVTDHRAGQFGDPPDLHHALRHRKPEEEVVLLAHQPREISEAKKHDVGLQLSGHTHGGQFWPWNWAVHLVEPVVAGLARFGRTQIYVNTGTGYWGPPMRLGTDSEITLVTLRSPT